MTIDITSPCHNAALAISTRMEGGAYTTHEVPDQIWCRAPGCHNSWDANGAGDEWNRFGND